MIGPATTAIAAGTVAGRLGIAPPVVCGAVVGLALAPGPTAAAGLLVWAVTRFRTAAGRRRLEEDVAAAALETSELLGLALAGGISIAGAYRLARDFAPPVVLPHVDRLLMEMDHRGVAAALAADRGPMATASEVLLTAATAGAPALPALEAHVRHLQHAGHTARVERARRLPVRLLIPLTLVVLPGFVLMTVGPAVVESLARLAP